MIGGRGMHVAHAAGELSVDGPCLVDRYLEGALELDVDALCDGEGAWVAADARAHRAARRPLRRLGLRAAGAVGVRRRSRTRSARLRRAIAAGLGARGLINLQLALTGGELWVLEANPRASRTVPFVAKATGMPLVEHAVPAAARRELDALGLPERAVPTRVWAKEAVFPAERFAGAASRGPEMRSTGEVMAGAGSASEAYRRALRAAGRARRGGAVAGPLQAAGEPARALN